VLVYEVYALAVSGMRCGLYAYYALNVYDKHHMSVKPYHSVISRPERIALPRYGYEPASKT